MIQSREEIVWVRAGDGSLTPFDEPRLAESIQRATAVCGQADEPVAESVAAAMQKCLNEGIFGRTITTGELVERVTAILSLLGYQEAAGAYTRTHHHAEIRLDELVAGTETAWELEFFRRLDRELAAASADGRLALLHVHGLRLCVLRLRGAKRWGTGCYRLAEDIVRHVRERVLRTRPPQAAELSLAVGE